MQPRNPFFKHKNGISSARTPNLDVQNILSAFTNSTQPFDCIYHIKSDKQHREKEASGTTCSKGG